LPRLDLGEAPEGIIELSNEEILKEFIETLQAAGASRDTIKALLSRYKGFSTLYQWKTTTPSYSTRCYRLEE
jgi:hypothetical protein